MIKTVRAVVDLPDSILALIKVDKDQLGPFIMRSLAVELYCEGRLSLGKAAELAGSCAGVMTVAAVSSLMTKIFKNDQMMMPQKYRIIIEKDPEEGVYIASVPALPGCDTFGKNAKEAALMAEEAIDVYIETLLDLGKRVPVEDA